MKKTRREFLQELSLMIAVSQIGKPQNIFANTVNSHNHTNPNLIIFNVKGGLDVLCGLDPVLNHNNEIYKLYTDFHPDEALIVNNDILGPTCKSLLPFLDEMAIVRGIYHPEDAGHDTLNRYMSSGVPLISPADLSVELINFLKTDDNNARLITSSDYFIGSRNIDQIEHSFFERKNLDSKETSNTFDYLQQLRAKNSNSNFFTSIKEKEQEILDEIKKHGNKPLEILDDENIPRWLKPTIIGLSTGVGKIAYYANNEFIPEVNFQSLDSHGDHINIHKSAQELVWSKIAQTLEILKKTPHKTGSLLDYTTVIVTTEMSRTPFLNASKGKDHNPKTNSAVFFGHGVKGNQIIGGSKVIKNYGSKNTEHIGRLYDFKNNESITDNHQQRLGDDNVGFITPKTIAATIAAHYGVNEKIHNGYLKNEPTLNGLFTKGES